MSRPSHRASRRMSTMITGGQLVAWMNELLGSSHEGFEDFCSGEEYCKLLQTLRPGSLSLKKVRSGATMESERLRNFKLLQQGLEKAGLDKKISIDGLMAGRFRDHYDLSKWFKNIFDQAQHGGGDGGPAAQEGQAAAASASVRRSRRLAGLAPALPVLAEGAPRGRQPRTTESEVRQLRERLSRARVGRDVYRSALLAIGSLCQRSNTEGDEDGAVVDRIIEQLDALHLDE